MIMTEEEKTARIAEAVAYGHKVAKEMSAEFTAMARAKYKQKLNVGPQECMGLLAWGKLMELKCKELKVNLKYVLRIIRGTK